MKKYCAAFLLALQMVGFVWTPVNADAGENRITEVQIQEEGKTGIWRKEGRKTAQMILEKAGIRNEQYIK